MYLLALISISVFIAENKWFEYLLKNPINIDR